MSATTLPSSALPPAVPSHAVLGTSARRQVRRMQNAVLTFFVVDGLLLTGYGAAGTIAPHVGWIYGLLGCLVSGPLFVWFWRRGGRVDHLDPLGFAQTLFTAATMLATLAVAPQIGGLMLMSLMALMALAAVQMKGALVIALCISLPLASLLILAGAGTPALIPTANTSERLLTGVWLAWLMAKCSAHNVVGTELRKMVGKANVELGAALSAVERVAATDDLTALPNRRAIIAELAKALSPDRRRAAAVGVALADLDHFKQINDRFGHDVGDQVLRVFAGLAATRLRPSDHVGRYGGEEFLLVLERVADRDAAGAAAERLRSVIEAHDWSALAPGLAVTMSVGVAVVGTDEDGAAAIGRADVALYQAKRGGRNRIVLA